MASTVTTSDPLALPAAERAAAETATTSGPPATPRPVRGARRRAVLRTFLLALPVPIAVLGLWSLGVWQDWTLPLDIRMGDVPTPWAVAVRLADLAVGGIIDDPYSGELWRHAWASLVRALSGFAIAAALAIPLGILMGRSRTLMRMLEPSIHIVRPIPVTAWAPLTLIVIGIGDRSAIFLVFLAAFFPILVNTVAAVVEVPGRLLEASAMLGMRRARRLYKVVLPAAMPGIVSGLRVGVGLAWALLVVGELTGINVGLGAMINEGKVVSKIDLIIAGMVVIGLLGFLTDRALVRLIKLAYGRRPILQEQS